MIRPRGNGRTAATLTSPVRKSVVDNPLRRGARGGRAGTAGRLLLGRRRLRVGLLRRAGLLAGTGFLAGPRTRPRIARAGLAGRPVARACGLFVGFAAVGAVEAAALEHDAYRVEELAQPARALVARGQRVIGEGLHDVEAVVALGARVAIGRHKYLRKMLSLFSTLSSQVLERPGELSHSPVGMTEVSPPCGVSTCVIRTSCSSDGNSPTNS